MFTVSVVLDGTELTPLQQRTMFKLIGCNVRPPDDMVLGTNAVFGIWVYMLIQKLKFLEPEQRAFLAEQCIADLSPVGDFLLDERKSHGHAIILVVADGRCVTWYRRGGWLDLVTGESVKEPPVSPLEAISYNLATLFRRNKAACETLQQRRAKNAADSTPPKSESTLS